MPNSVPNAGQLVQVRQRRYVVQDVLDVGKGWREADAEGRAPGTLEGDLEFLARAQGRDHP
jgi:hypothetical protein